jgi:aerobic-type carbon monoxide dehydrogenase small subunit (CoxS/CutS family)
MEFSFRLNGREVRLAGRPDESLLDLLRLECGLGGARESCGLGVCGACTVLVDGRPVSSCLLPAALARGTEVTTIEGLGGEGGQLDPVQEAFLAERGFQCGYCTPGMILMARALLAENPRPGDDEIRAYLAGNVCRCGSHETILRAVRRAARGASEGAG